MKVFNKLKTHFHSLRAQLIFFIALTSVLILGIGTFFCERYAEDVFESKNEKYMVQQFSQSDHNISTVLNEVDSLSKLFINDDAVQQYLVENYGSWNFDTIQDYRSVLSRMDSFISNYSYINSIFLYTKNGGEIGSSLYSSYTTRVDYSRSGFFSSDIYKNAESAFPKSSLGGGITENFYNPNLRENNNYLISIVRSVKPKIETKKSATLIFNLDESYLSSIYCNNTYNDEHMYIVDSDGTIVSSRDVEDINKKSQSFSAKSFDGTYGTFTSKRNDVLVQVVYYKLSNSKWYLIDEIPMSDLADDSRSIRRIIIMIFCLSALSIVVISYVLLRKITKPLVILSDKMSDMGSGKFGVTLKKIPNNELGILINRFNEMSLNIAQLMKRNDEIQEQKIKLELEALQAQINPHFIYNTLNMIRWMAAMIKANNIVDSIVALGNMLSPTFRDKSTEWTIESETKYLDNYLKIMNWRYGNKLEFDFDVPENILNAVIPKFILQPIVENSVTHGANELQKIQIEISASELDNQLLLTIKDNGIGIDQETLNKLNNSFKHYETDSHLSGSNNIGLCNVNKRIKLNYGDEYGLTIESEKGTTVYVKMPKIFNKGDKLVQ